MNNGKYPLSTALLLPQGFEGQNVKISMKRVCQAFYVVFHVCLHITKYLIRGYDNVFFCRCLGASLFNHLGLRCQGVRWGSRFTYFCMNIGLVQHQVVNTPSLPIVVRYSKCLTFYRVYFWTLRPTGLLILILKSRR